MKARVKQVTREALTNVLRHCTTVTPPLPPPRLSLAKSKCDFLPLIMSLCQSLSTCSPAQITQILSNFILNFDKASLIDIIFSGLYRMHDKQKSQWIPFLIEQVNATEPHASSQCQLFNLHDDALTHICQYLSIHELAIFERCHSWIFSKIRTSPCFISSLDYPNWSLFYLQPAAFKLTRLLNVKRMQLFFERKQIQQSPLLFDPPNWTAFGNVLKHITHLTIVNDEYFPTSSELPSLQSITAYNVSPSALFRLILPSFGSDLHSLRELRMHWNNLAYDLLPNIRTLLHSKLKTLVLDFGDNSYYKDHLTNEYQWNCIEEEISSTDDEVYPLYDTLRHLKYVAIEKLGAHSSTNCDLLMNLLLSHCRYLEHFELDLAQQDEFKAIVFDGHFANEIKWNVACLKELRLHVSSVNVSDVLQHLLQNEARLNAIDLLLWDQVTDAVIQRQGSDVLAVVRDLLCCQMRSSTELRDIQLRFEMKLSNEEFVQQMTRLRLLYLMLSNVFEDERVHKRNEMNICIRMICNFESIYNVSQNAKHIRCEFYLLDRLLTALHAKVECFRVKLIVDMPPVWRRYSEYHTLPYWLNSKHEFTTRVRQNGRIYIVTNASAHAKDCKMCQAECFGQEQRFDEEEKQRTESRSESDELTKTVVVDVQSFENYPELVLPMYCPEELRCVYERIDAERGEEDDEVILSGSMEEYPKPQVWVFCSWCIDFDHHIDGDEAEAKTERRAEEEVKEEVKDPAEEDIEREEVKEVVEYEEDRALFIKPMKHRKVRQRTDICMTDVCCFVCGRNENVMRCSQCKGTFYCSREHQIMDWPRHCHECL
eukprot:CAMPEP_0197036626 /NCGR_PEP_ID=MMETSP1384-20130603/14079_1 /TAXON_ID=29189 /ORGANISM="Ammonia sp." /LENGTH=822 /DNA_ID=CAMNT_0042466823 /DNA_START=81 /DNA_END=2549 /DNA_ORIENTATION=+